MKKIYEKIKNNVIILYGCEKMRLKNIKGASDKIKEGKYFIINPNEYKGKWNNGKPYRTN